MKVTDAFTITNKATGEVVCVVDTMGTADRVVFNMKLDLTDDNDYEISKTKYVEDKYYE